jgi:hypothetical protein
LVYKITTTYKNIHRSQLIKELSLKLARKDEFIRSYFIPDQSGYLLCGVGSNFLIACCYLKVAQGSCLYTHLMQPCGSLYDINQGAENT